MREKIIAFDIGGTSLRAAIVKNNKILKKLRCPTPKDKTSFLKQVDEYTTELMSKDIKGIGVGIAGVIVNGVVKTSPNLPIHNFNLKDYMEKKYKVKTIVLNDAACFSLAELKLGCKKKNFVIMTLGTGIGGGIIINGKPYDGTGFGGEIGHIYVNGEDFEKSWKRTRAKMNKLKKGCLIKDLVRIGTPECKNILVESADYLGKGISSIISILDPEIVILAGGPSESGASFINLIKKSTKKYMFLPKTTPIQWTKLSYPGILGASLLVK